ncbi:SDR family NAD(P)-dependent oxidoreductase [Microbacterium ulmi]|uniref:SDR family NAD(P)-dependent oxidoreductase n=1 Tax=Microbacterium ulmi TaxID=179095 RepID=UPI00313320E5|nr:NAD(P)-dependent dehydrogenase (short-subunit alcohol dehydrogenase family) [Microbacterium ulmi]
MAKDWLGLEGRRVLLVGAGGLGAALVTAYLEVGARVLVVDRDRELLNELESRHAETDGLSTIAADVTDRETCVDVVGRASQELGGLDVLVHAVGVNNRVSIDEIDPPLWELIMSVNVESALWLAQAASRRMLEGGGGHIVFISSVAGLLAHRHHGVYAASKAALNQLMRTMAIEWAERGIAVNAIAPGYTLTPLTADYCAIPGNTEKLVSLIPMGRLGRPEDIVGPTLLLSSDRAGFVTGQVMYVDGGRTID